jgi:hypothetical protein
MTLPGEDLTSPGTSTTSGCQSDLPDCLCYSAAPRRAVAGQNPSGLYGL